MSERACDCNGLSYVHGDEEVRRRYIIQFMNHDFLQYSGKEMNPEDVYLFDIDAYQRGYDRGDRFQMGLVIGKLIERTRFGDMLKSFPSCLLGNENRDGQSEPNECSKSS